jgi:hypothetical protein
MDGEDEINELPITDDGPTEDVDIEITEDDLGESLVDYTEEEAGQQDQDTEQADPEAAEDEAASDDEDDAPKKRRSPQARISELARQKAEAERRAQELEARLSNEAQLRQQSEMAMMTHYKNNLLSQAGTVKQQLVEAHSLGDTEKIIDLQAQYYKLQSDLSGVENWEAQQKVEAPAVQQPTQQKAGTPTLEPRTAQWIQSNTWFQPQSEDFDPEMHEEATLYARRVERRYRAEGRADDIGSLDYFTEIDRHMRKEFPDAFSEVSPPSKKSPPMGRDSKLAPVQNSAVPGQPQKNSKTIRLTADQRRMAHQLAQSGAIKKPNGSRMSEIEAEKHYAIYLMKQGKGA